MTAFRIHCPTCSSRLKVKSLKLIGQIVNCPKCGSMVEITAPATMAEDKPRPKASAPAAAAVPPAQALAPEDVQASAGSSDEIFEGVEEMLDPPPAADTAETTGETIDPEETVAAAGRFSDGAAVSRWRGIALVGGASVMALVTFGAIGYALFGGREPVEVAQFEPPPVEENQEDTPPPSVPPVVNTGEPEAEDTEAQDAKSQTADSQAAPDQAVSDVQPTADRLPADTVSETGRSPQSPADDEPGSSATADIRAKGMMNAPSEEPVKNEMAGAEDNPFLFGQSPATPGPADSKEGTPSGQPAAASGGDKRNPILELKDDPLYEVFGESFPVFDPETFEQSALSKVDTPADETPPAAMPDIPPTPQPVPPTPAVDVAARLGDPIVRVEFGSIPLNQFASFITQMSTVPVTLDPVALAYADISSATPVVVQQSQTSVRGVLEAVVRPFGLEIQATDAGARLQIQSPVDGKLRAARLQCEDLAVNDQQVAELAYLLTHLVEPRSWKQAGGPGLYRNEPGAIMLSQTEVAHFQAIMFLEKLRVARGLTPRSQYSKPRFDLTPRADQVASALTQDVQVQIVVPTPLFKVVDQLEKSSGLAILCDWDSLAVNKLGPATPVTLSAQGIPLEDALRNLCQPWKMAVVPIDAGTVQLVAEQSLPVRPWLEFYDVGNLELSRAEATALINEAKRHLSDLRKTGLGNVLYDPASQHLLALLSKDDHQRLRLLLNRRQSP